MIESAILNIETKNTKGKRKTMYSLTLFTSEIGIERLMTYQSVTIPVFSPKSAYETLREMGIDWINDNNSPWVEFHHWRLDKETDLGLSVIEWGTFELKETGEIKIKHGVD